MIKSGTLSLKGTVQKDGASWMVSIPAMNYHATNHTLLGSIRKVETYLKDEIKDFSCAVRMSDGGNFDILAPEQMRKYIS